MSGAQAWHIVLNGMKAANAGWITRIEAEHYSTSISLALKPYWSITTQRATESCAVVVAGLRGVIVPLHVGLARASARPEQAPGGEQRGRATASSNRRAGNGASQIAANESRRRRVGRGLAARDRGDVVLQQIDNAIAMNECGLRFGDRGIEIAGQIVDVVGFRLFLREYGCDSFSYR